MPNAKRERHLKAVAIRGRSIHSITTQAKRQRDVFDPEGRFSTFGDKQFLAIIDYVAAVVYNHAVATGFYSGCNPQDVSGHCFPDRGKQESSY